MKCRTHLLLGVGEFRQIFRICYFCTTWVNHARRVLLTTWLKLLFLMTHTMDQEVSRLSLNSEIWVWICTSICGICGSQSGSARAFTLATLVLHCQYICTDAPCLYFIQTFAIASVVKTLSPFFFLSAYVHSTSRNVKRITEVIVQGSPNPSTPTRMHSSAFVMHPWRFK